MADAYRHISILIERPAASAYAFAAQPENLCRWASGLGRMPRPENGEWLAQSDAGPVRIRFCQPNALGVLDHVVRGEGWQVHVPMRVIDAGHEASLLTLTLFRQPGMSDEQFARDIAWVEKDLATLKGLLEA